MRKVLLIILAVVLSSYAEAKPRGAPNAVPQIFYNIVTDGGASCPGDATQVTRNLTAVSGNTTISVSVDTFVTGDIGKLIIIPGAGFGGSTRTSTITGVSAFAAGKQDITIALAPQTSLTGVSTTISYGTDDAPKFATFNTWARANQGANNQVVLTIPSGYNCWFGSSNSISGVTLTNAFAAGINNLIVEGTGATINSVNGFGFQLGGQGIIQKGLTDANGKSARIQSVSAGATQVSLTPASFSAGYIGRFAINQWIMIGGVDPQGLWNSPYGFPPNNRYFEWRQITAICNNTGPCSGTATITLDRALTNSYLSTWPNWNSGGAFEVDQGGPATIFALNDTWNTTVQYRGLTINQSGQVYAQGRNITFMNVTFGGTLGGIPTQNEIWTAINTTWGPGTILETDKLVGIMTMDNVSIPRLDFQSSSTDLFVLKNSTLNTLFGTPTRTEITDTTITTFRPGATGYGQSESVSCIRCNITTFDFNGGVLTPQGGSPFNISMSAGVLSFPNVDQSGPYPTGIEFIPPNGNVYWGGGGFATIGLFNVQAMTQDATNAYVQTNEVGGLPGISGGVTGLRTHPAPQFTCTDPNAASDPTFIMTCTNAGATALAPLGSYSFRSYAPTSAQGNLGSLINRGKLVSLTVDVTQAYSGTGSATLNPTGQFHLFTVKQSDWSSYDWVPSINLKQAGTRVITPSGVTCNGSPGACAGDGCVQPASGCYALPEAIWFSGANMTPYMGSTLGAGTQPQFTITLRTDQGVVP